MIKELAPAQEIRQSIATLGLDITEAADQNPNLEGQITTENLPPLRTEPLKVDPSQGLERALLATAGGVLLIIADRGITPISHHSTEKTLSRYGISPEDKDPPSLHTKLIERSRIYLRQEKKPSVTISARDYEIGRKASRTFSELGTLHTPNGNIGALALSLLEARYKLDQTEIEFDQLFGSRYKISNAHIADLIVLIADQRGKEFTTKGSRNN